MILIATISRVALDFVSIIKGKSNESGKQSDPNDYEARVARIAEEH